MFSRRAVGVGLAVGAVAVPLLLTPAPAQDAGGYHAEIRNRIARWEQDPALQPYAHAPAPAPVPVPVAIPFPAAAPGVGPGGRGFAVCVGLNAVDPARYGGWSGELAGCHNDARDMARIAAQQGFTVTQPLLTQQATRAAFAAEIRRLARDLRANDILMVSYSGHGGQMRDQNGDEPDGKDETWCFYDGQVSDDELARLWAELPAGVRLLVVSDSCHSGSVTKFNQYTRMLDIAPPTGTRDVNPADARQRGEQLVQVLTTRATPQELNKVRSPWRSVPEVVIAAIEADPVVSAEYRARTLAAGLEEQSRAATGAAVLLISGCTDEQLSLDGAGNGLFTSKFKEVWADGRFPGQSYDALRKDILARMPPTQQPQLFTYGPGADRFAAQRPFAR